MRRNCGIGKIDLGIECRCPVTSFSFSVSALVISGLVAFGKLIMFLSWGSEYFWALKMLMTETSLMSPAKIEMLYNFSAVAN